MESLSNTTQDARTLPATLEGFCIHSYEVIILKKM